MDSPPDGLVKLVAGEVYDGRLTQQVRETIGSATVAAFREIVRDRLRTRLNSALEDTPGDNQTPDVVADTENNAGDEIETTQEEIEGWLTIKAILRQSVDANRISMRDAKSYCAILLDNNNRKPLARLHFNGAKRKLIGLFDGDKEERIELVSLNDIFLHADRLRATAEKYQG